MRMGLATFTDPRRFLWALMGLSPVRRQSIISFASSVIVTFSGYLATVIFAHTVGPGTLGSYFLFLAWVGVASGLSDGGFSGACAKKISEGRQPGSWFGAYIVIRLVLLAVSVCILLILEPLFVDLSACGLFFPFIIAFITGSLCSIAATAVYGSGHVGVSQTADLVGTLARTCIQVIAVLAGFSVGGLIGGFFVGMMAGVLVNIRFLPVAPQRFGATEVRGLSRYALWAFLGGLTGLASGQLDTVLIGYFLSNESVGFYRTALQFSSMVLFACVAVRTVLFPRISQWHAEKATDAISALVARSFTYSLLLALPACTGGLILGQSLVFFLYGEAFLPAVPALSVLLVAQLVSVFPSILMTTLSAADKPHDAFFVGGAGVVVTAVVCWISIPLIGMIGAGVGVLAGNLTSLVLGVIRAHTILPIHLEISPLIKLLFSTLLMGILLAAMECVLPISSIFILFAFVLTGVCVYGGATLLLEPGIRDEFTGIIRHFGVRIPGDPPK